MAIRDAHVSEGILGIDPKRLAEIRQSGLETRSPTALP
jgi:hypothetical protein